MHEPKTTGVQATKTSLRIVSAIEERGGTATITELAGELELAKSTVYKHLLTLETAGVVVAGDDGYRLGLRCLNLGGIARRYDGVYEIARPEVRKMAEETGELANLMFEEGGLGTYVYTARGERAIDVDTRLGQRVYLHTTALGKALLSSLPDDRVTEIVDEHGLPAETEATITDREELFAELEEIREEGFAFNREERVGGLGCVAAPIDTGDRRNAAISIMTPISRLTADRSESQYTDVLGQTANVIELNLAHAGEWQA